MSDDFDERLKAGLKDLPREIPPGRELWSGIERRIERQTPASVWILPAAAALVLGIGVASSLGGRDREGAAKRELVAEAKAPSTPSVARETPLLPHEPEVRVAVADLREVYEGHRSRLDPELVKLFDEEIDAVAQAVATSRQALAHNPGDPHLRQMLDHAYAHQLQLFKHAASTRGHD